MSTDPNAAALAHRIRTAFANVPPPEPGALWVPHWSATTQRWQGGLLERVWGDQWPAIFETGSFLCPPRWEDIPLDTLQTWFSPLEVASPPAFRYWLPRYLLAAVNDPEHADASSVSLVISLRYPGDLDYARSDDVLARFATLDDAQRECVRDVLRYLDTATGGPRWPDVIAGAQAALRDCWGEHPLYAGAAVGASDSPADESTTPPPDPEELARQRDALVARVRRAFADVPCPSADDLWMPDYIDIWSDADGMCPTCWEDIPPAALRGCGFRLRRASVATFRFWLPRYLIGVLVEPDAIDDALDDIEFGLRYPGSLRTVSAAYVLQRYTSLTPEQAACVRDVLRHMCVDPEYVRLDLREAARISLAEYWDHIDA